MKYKFFLLVPVAGLIFAGTACNPSGNSSPSSEGTGPAPTLVPVQKVLSTFSPIEGTNYLMAGITANISREQSGNPIEWIIQSSYSSSGYNTYNFVFFNIETETYQRLLPTNDTAIVNVVGFPEKIYNPSDNAEVQPPYEWWFYVIVKSDTSQNGVLDYEDKLTLGISDVGGNGYAEMIADVDKVLGTIYKDGSVLFVFYNSNNKNFIAKISLPTREIITTTEINLGEDVK
jgi:hypothetical protein